MSHYTNEIIKKLFNSLLQIFHKGLEESMKGSDFVFDYIESLNYIFHKVDLKRSGSYIETLDWIEKKKGTINCHNYDDDRCFQYSIINALNYDKIGKHHQRVNRVKPFVNQYDWSEMNSPSHVSDWKKFELNNKSIAFNVLYVPEGEKAIRHAYKSKYNLKRENQVILLMITNGEKWHYLTVRRLSALLKGATSSHNGDCCCLNCFHSYRTEEALKEYVKVCEDYVKMPEKETFIKYHYDVKSMRAPFVMYADLESLLNKMDVCINDPSKSSTTKINKHEMCGYSLITHCSFDEKNNTADYYRGKDYLKKFCQGLKKQGRLVVDYEKKEMIKLTQEGQYRHDTRKLCFLCKKPFFEGAKNNYIKVRDHCHCNGKYRGAAHKICNLMYNTPREIPVVFHNGSSYDYHFIIKGLAKKFEVDFGCLCENKKKYITFSVPIKKEYNEGSTKIYKIKFIDSFRFMSTSLSSLVDNLSDKIHNDGKCANCVLSLDYISTTTKKW